MAYNKIGRLKVRTSVMNQHDVETNYVFYSYDKGTAALDFWLKNQKNEAMDLTNVTVKFLFTSIQEGEERTFTYLDSQPIINQPKEGRVLYPLPEKLLNYNGEIKGYLYLDFEDGSHSDEVSFTFRVVRSKIDEALEEVNEVYVKDFEQVRTEVFETAKREKEAIESLRPTMEQNMQELVHQLKTLHQTVTTEEQKVQHLLELIEGNNTLTTKEILVAFARGYFEFTREVTFDKKVVGSTVENPHIASSPSSSRLEVEYPTPSTSLSEMSAYPNAEHSRGYTALQGGNTYPSSVSSQEALILYLRIQWNIVEDIRRWLGDVYFQGSSLSEQVSQIEKGLFSIVPKNQVYGTYRSSKTNEKGSGVVLSWYDNQTGAWKAYARNDERRLDTCTAIIAKEGSERYLDAQGRVNLLIETKPGDDVSIVYNKATLQYTYRLYLADFFYSKKNQEIVRMQAQIQQLWNKVFD